MRALKRQNGLQKCLSGAILNHMRSGAKHGLPLRPCRILPIGDLLFAYLLPLSLAKTIRSLLSCISSVRPEMVARPRLSGMPVSVSAVILE